MKFKRLGVDDNFKGANVSPSVQYGDLNSRSTNTHHELTFINLLGSLHWHFDHSYMRLCVYSLVLCQNLHSFEVRILKMSNCQPGDNVTYTRWTYINNNVPWIKFSFSASTRTVKTVLYPNPNVTCVPRWLYTIPLARAQSMATLNSYLCPRYGKPPNTAKTCSYLNLL